MREGPIITPLRPNDPGAAREGGAPADYTGNAGS